MKKKARTFAGTGFRVNVEGLSTYGARREVLHASLVLTLPVIGYQPMTLPVIRPAGIKRWQHWCHRM